MADTASASYIAFSGAGGSWCTGVSAIWNSVSLGLVTEIDATIGGSLPLGRDSTFAVDAGTISIKCLSTAGLGISQCGLQATLDIQGGGLAFTHKAICQTLTRTGKVNDVARYGATFKLVRQ